MSLSSKALRAIDYRVIARSHSSMLGLAVAPPLTAMAFHKLSPVSRMLASRWSWTGIECGESKPRDRSDAVGRGRNGVPAASEPDLDGEQDD
jgi:hypothetical protein